MKIMTMFSVKMTPNRYTRSEAVGLSTEVGLLAFVRVVSLLEEYLLSVRLFGAGLQLRKARNVRSVIGCELRRQLNAPAGSADSMAAVESSGSSCFWAGCRAVVVSCEQARGRLLVVVFVEVV